MRIAILVGKFLPRWLAGMEIATYNIAKYLAKRGHEIHVVTLLDEELPKESMEDGFHVHRIGYPKVPILGFIMIHIKVLLLLKKINPDVTHAQGTLTGWMTLVAKRMFNKPYLVWSHGYNDLFLGVRRTISRLAFRNADAVIALTEDMKREIQKIWDRDVYVIPNGIDLERFESLSGEETRSKLQIKQEEVIIIYVGRFRPEKGIQYLIQAMDIIRQKEANARLILGGEGPEEENLKRLVEQANLGNCINFIGQIPNEKVHEYMAAADVFVLPSLSEGFPIVSLEAMASGLPIVTTKVRGLPEIVKDGENGFLVEPKNPEQIAEKVLLLLEDEELRKRISENNRARAKEYSWESVIDRLEEVYKAIRK